jgi:spermidine/putrescine transport system permease protein
VARRSAPTTRVGPLAAAAPAALGFGLVFLVPVGIFAIYSFLTASLFSASGPLTLENYSDVLHSSTTLKLAGNSLAVGAWTGVVCVAVGLPVAYWLRFCAGRFQIPLLFLFVVCMFASYLVRIYAWRTVLGERGLINQGLMQLGIVDEPIDVFLFSRTAVVIALVHILLPYVVLVLFSGFRSMPESLLEAAQDLGAGWVQRWRKVILPAMAEPAASAFLFVFVIGASDYVAPQFLGGRGNSMLGVRVEQDVTAVGNWPRAAATSFLMVLAFLLIAAIVTFGLRLRQRQRLGVAR